MNEEATAKDHEGRPPDIARKVGFKALADTLRTWKGRSVRIELGVTGALGVVGVIVGHRVLSVSEVSACDGPHVDQTMYLELADEMGKRVASLVMDEGAFESARDYGDEKLVMHATGVHLIVEAEDARQPAEVEA